MRIVPINKDVVDLCLFGGSRGSFFANLVLRAGRMLAPRVRIRGVVASSKPKSALSDGQTLGIEHVFESLDDFLTNASKLGYHGVLIETPNSTHYPIAQATHNAGLCVASDKPTAHCFRDAVAMGKFQDVRPTLVMNTYEGNATWRMTRQIVRSGVLGRLLRIKGTYTQKWLGNPLEIQPTAGGHQQAVARLDPNVVGPFCSGLDLGIHVVRSIQSLTGQLITNVTHFEHHTHVKGRQMDDHSVLRGTLADGTLVSVEPIQVSWHRGGRNDHEVTFDFEGGSLTLSQLDTEALEITIPSFGRSTFYRGENYTEHPVLGTVFKQDAATSNVWMGGPPSAHPLGIHDSLAALIGAWTDDVRTYVTGGGLPKDTWYPNLRDGATDWAVYEAARQIHTGEAAPVAVPSIA